MFLFKCVARKDSTLHKSVHQEVRIYVGVAAIMWVLRFLSCQESIAVLMSNGGTLALIVFEDFRKRVGTIEPGSIHETARNFFRE